MALLSDSAIDHWHNDSPLSSGAIDHWQNDLPLSDSAIDYWHNDLPLSDSAIDRYGGNRAPITQIWFLIKMKIILVIIKLFQLYFVYENYGEGCQNR